jgi:hypothetical protein
MNCGGAPDGDEAPLIGEVQEAIQGGYAVSGVEYDGIVSLEVLDSTNAWNTFCSGTLKYNGMAITAAHCLRDLPAKYRDSIYVRMGSQQKLVTSYVTNPVWDVAYLYFDNMLMYNWWENRYLTSPAKLTWNDYSRTCYSGSNESLNGTNLDCYGYGPGGYTRQLTYASFPVAYEPNDGSVSKSEELHLYYPPNVAVQHGDSGMGCLTRTYGSRARDPLAGVVNTASLPSPNRGSFASAVSPATFLATPIRFSSGGQIAGMKKCIQLWEPADPDTWGDNYLCLQNDIGLTWSNNGDPSVSNTNLKCTKINEPAEPASHTWEDNYLCQASFAPLTLYWSFAGPMPGKSCTPIREPADPHAWNDNYLCWF